MQSENTVADFLHFSTFSSAAIHTIHLDVNSMLSAGGNHVLAILGKIVKLKHKISNLLRNVIRVAKRTLFLQCRTL